MKIVLLGDALVLQRAGVYYYTFDFYKRLMKYFPDHDYSLIVPNTFGKLEVEEKIVPIKSSIPFHNRMRQFVDIPKMVKLLNADIVIEPAHFGPFNLPSHIKRITIIHDLTAINHPEFHKTIDVWAHRLFMKRVIKNAWKIIVNSHCTANDLRDYDDSSASKIVLSYPSPKPKDSVDNNNVFISSEGDYILSVGTVEPRKNYLNLVKSFDRISMELPNLKLVIVGQKGWKNQALDKYLESRKNKNSIVFKGYVDSKELNRLYAHAKAFIYPSFYEGFGLPLIEAMQFGLPLLLSNTRSLKEVGGENALYFEPDNIEEISNQIKALLMDVERMEKLKTQSQNRIEELKSLSEKSMISLGETLGLG